MNLLLIIFIATALVFDFLNGFHDSANVVATAIASRAIPPRWALAMASLTNFIGPFVFGVAVATTIGEEVITDEAVTIPVALAALVSAILWNILTWLLGIPSSSSHGLMGGFVGAALAGYGTEAIQIDGLMKVIIGLLVSPFIGLFFGWIIMRLVLFFGHWFTPGVNNVFRKAQWITSGTLGLSHGTNDAQKTMGIIALGLVAFGVIPEFYVPSWVVFISASAIALGTAFGGWRLIRTMGAGFYRVRAAHAFSSQSASTVVILVAALLGTPVSTTQVIGSTIVGAGSAHRVSMIRWGLAGQIVAAWVITIPATILVGAVVYWILDLVL